MAKKSADDLLNVAEAANRLDVSPRQVRNLIASGILAAQKLGRDYIIRRLDIENVPKIRKRGPRPKPRHN